MKKSIIVLLINCVLALNMLQAQHVEESTMYCLEIKNNNILKTLKCCIKDIHEWNTENKNKNGIIQIYLSNENNGYTMTMNHYYPQDTLIQTMPDYYSYIDNQIVLWYMGKVRLTQNTDNYFKLFVTDIYSKYILEQKDLNSANASTNIKKIKSLEEIPKIIVPEQMEKHETVHLNTASSFRKEPYTFTIKVLNNESLKVTKSQIVSG